MVESNIKQVFAVGYEDKLSGIEFVGFECETNLFKQSMQLFTHFLVVLRDVFGECPELIDIISSFEANPNAQGGIFELFESLKVALLVLQLYLYVLTFRQKIM